MKSITLGIVTKNRSKLLQQCLLSLTKQICLPTEVIIVNNASTDATKDVIRSFKNRLPIRYFLERNKDGIPLGRNIIIKQAKGDIVAYIDDDCMAPKDWVENIIVAHNGYPTTIAIQGGFKPYRPSLFQKLIALRYKKWFQNHIYDGKYISFCDTKNFSLKVEKIRKKKLSFDANFYRGSDVDFAFLLTSQGERIRYEESIFVYHRERQTFFQALIQQYNQGKPYAMLQKKWPPAMFIKSDSSLLEGMNFFEKLSLPHKIKIKIYTFFLSLVFSLGFIESSKSFIQGYFFLPKLDTFFLKIYSDRTLQIYRSIGKGNSVKEIDDDLLSMAVHITLHAYFSKTNSLFRRIIAHKLKRYIKNTVYEEGLRYCPVCKNDVIAFISMAVKGRDNVICPKCGSRERQRLLTLFLQKEINFFQKTSKILEIGPSKGFMMLCKRNNKIQYISIDLTKEIADKKMDVTKLDFESNMFDYVICSHVLEHVKDDMQGIKEMYRILKKNGTCFIMVPLDQKRQKILEERKNQQLTSEKREQLFGQSDHVRIYGKDFIQRLEKAGFSVEVIKYAKKLTKEEKDRFGIKESYKTSLYTTTDDIYMCKRVT